MIKAVFFDIDGTILSHTKKKVPDSTVEGISKLQLLGIQVYACTGRHLCELDDLPLCDIPFDGYVLLNGQIILDKDKRIIVDTPLNSYMTDNIVSIFNEKIIPMILVEESELYLNFVNDLVLAVQNSISSPIPPVKSYSNNTIYMASAFVNANEQDDLSSLLTGGLKVTRWNSGGVDIILDGDGKVDGIKKLLDITGIQRKEIMAFGDAENDISMLEFAGIGVAMGNAEKRVKEIADYVADHIDNDGIIKALNHFVFNKQ